MDKPQKRDDKWFPEFLGSIKFERRIGYNKSCDDHKEYFKYLLSKIPSDKEIKNSPAPEYAGAFYQGQFDLLMNLIHEEN